jgi:hypothetical protein
MVDCKTNKTTSASVDAQQSAMAKISKPGLYVIHPMIPMEILTVGRTAQNVPNSVDVRNPGNSLSDIISFRVWIHRKCNEPTLFGQYHVCSFKFILLGSVFEAQIDNYDAGHKANNAPQLRIELDTGVGPVIPINPSTDTKPRQAK